MPSGAKLFAPAAARNRQPILEVLREVLPAEGRALEIASGSGQHAAALAATFPGMSWQPSDVDPTVLASVDAWREETALPNLRPAIRLDVTCPWPIHGPFDAILCINLVHISPWETALALLSGAARELGEGGLLFLYGPYFVEGVDTAPSNLAFDESLRSRNSQWGVRQLGTVTREAEARGLSRVRVVEMPANNLSVIFKARCTSSSDPSSAPPDISPR